MGVSSNVNRASDIVYLLMLQAGVIPWSDDRLTPQFTQNVARGGNFVSPGSDAISFYTSFADPANLNYTWNTRSDYSIDSFANGRSAMLYSYSYTAQTLRQKSPNLNFDVAAVPQFDLTSPSVNFANYFGEAVNKQTAHSDAAWDFLKFISTKDSLDKYYAQDKLPSSRKDMIAQQIQDPDIGVFAHANLTAKPFYRPDQAKMDTIFTTLIDNISLRGMRVEEALSGAESQARTLIRR
jgi:ABC-type glycerol-3-phosphate transport system substrate-binding protein